MIRASRRSRAVVSASVHLGRHDLEGHLPPELAVAGDVDDAHAAPRHLLPELVPRAGEVRPLRDLPQVVEGPVAQLPHGTSTPRSALASERNSSSPAVISRSFSSTAARSSRRAQCR